MIRIARIPYEHMNWVWISNFYDVPLKGLCRYDSKLCFFQGFGWEYGKKMRRFHIFKLNLFDKIRWLFKKKSFEIMVGKHWSSYPDRVSYNSSKWNKFLTMIYYMCKPFYFKFYCKRLLRRIK